MTSVVTITSQVTATPTTTPSANTAPSSSLSTPAIVGITLGCLFGLGLVVGLALYLRYRHRRSQFVSVANPRQQWDQPPGSTPMASVQSRHWFGHAKQPTTSLEPLIPPVQWPATRSSPPRIQSPFTPPHRPNSPSLALPDIPASGDGHLNFNGGYFGTHAEVTREPGAAFSKNTFPPRTPEVIPPPHSRVVSHTSDERQSGKHPGHVSPRRSPMDSPSPSKQPETSSSQPLQPHPTLFISRALKTRAAASQYVADPPHPSSSHPGSPIGITPVGLSIDTEEAQVLMTLRDAEEAAWVNSQENIGSEEEEDPPDSASSEYSQLSAPLDHAAFLSTELARQNSSRSVNRRKSSRRRVRTPGATAELPPVAEVPDTPRNISLPGSPRATSSANVDQELRCESSSLSVEISHGRPSRPSSVVTGHDASFPLLSSNAFGKGKLTPAPSASSRSSDICWESSSSSGKASRYPSFAPSSNGQSSGSDRYSEGNTDWYRHQPSGLANLRNLQLDPLPTSVEPLLPSLLSDFPVSPPVKDGQHFKEMPDRRARLREPTSGSIPEIEKHSLQMGGIASIDVTL